VSITCQEAAELLAPLALGALDREERAAVEEHLTECRRHDAELSDNGLAVSALNLVTERPPPSALKVRLLAAFDSEVRDRQVPRFGRLLRLRLGSPAFAYGLAAALLLAVLGLVAWNLTLRSGDQAIERTVASEGMRLRVLYLPGESLAVVEAELRPLPADQTYQVWQIAGGRPVSLGLLSGSGPTVFRVAGGVEAIAISVEPAGGSPQPTTPPVLSAQLF
jgi:anti-sigma-K factor RskA